MTQSYQVSFGRWPIARCDTPAPRIACVRSPDPVIRELVHTSIALLEEPCVHHPSSQSSLLRLATSSHIQKTIAFRNSLAIPSPSVLQKNYSNDSNPLKVQKQFHFQASSKDRSLVDCKHRQRHCEGGGSEEEPTNHHLLLLARRSMGKCHKHSSNLSKNETSLQLAMSRS